MCGQSYTRFRICASNDIDYFSTVINYDRKMFIRLATGTNYKIQSKKKENLE